MCFFFFWSQYSVSNLEHIGIVPMTWSCGFITQLIDQEIRFHLLKLISFCHVNFNILSGSPRICNGGTPLCNSFISPIANWKKYLSSCIAQGVWHGWISFKGWNSKLIITIIILQVINPPTGISFSIRNFMS